MVVRNGDRWHKKTVAREMDRKPSLPCGGWIFDSFFEDGETWVRLYVENWKGGRQPEKIPIPLSDLLELYQQTRPNDTGQLIFTDEEEVALAA